MICVITVTIQCLLTFNWTTLAFQDNIYRTGAQSCKWGLKACTRDIKPTDYCCLVTDFHACRTELGLSPNKQNDVDLSHMSVPDMQLLFKPRRGLVFSLETISSKLLNAPLDNKRYCTISNCITDVCFLSFNSVFIIPC